MLDSIRLFSVSKTISKASSKTNVLRFSYFSKKATITRSNGVFSFNSEHNHPSRDFSEENRACSLTNPIQDEGRKMLPTSFSPVTSTIVKISPLNYLTFIFNPFVILVQNFKAIPSASPKLLNLNKDHPSKKVFFLVKFL